MFDKPFTAIDAAEIQALISNQVSEGRRLDYKEQFTVQSESEKKEFLSDVSAFANTEGGYLIYGIQEQRDGNNKPTGIPSAANGLANFNADSEILRLDAMIRDGLAPRLSGVLMKKVDGFPAGPVFIIHVPQSWNAPHMLTYQTKSPFHGRSNAGKFPLDIGQIRAAVTMSDSLSEKIRSFHQDRVSKVTGGFTAVPMEQERKKVILHIIPLAAFRGDLAVDVDSIRAHEARLAPISSYQGWDNKVNLEGMVYFSAARGQPAYSYAQIYRNGIVELVDNTVLGIHDRPIVPTTEFEQGIIQGVERYLKFLCAVGITGPGIIIMTLVGVNGMSLGVANPVNFPGMTPKQFDRDIVSLPEIMIDDFSTASDVVLKPVLDSVYNAAGWDRCINYNAQGRWQRPR